MKGQRRKRWRMESAEIGWWARRRWHDCGACGVQFRRERGWRVADLDGDRTARVRYVCGGCADDADRAIGALADAFWRRMRSWAGPKGAPATGEAVLASARALEHGWFRASEMHRRGWA